MLKEFKNFELVRHYFSTDIEDNVDLLSKQVKQGTKEIACTVFASASSLVSTYFIEEKIFANLSGVINVLLIILSYVVVFLFSYALFSLGYSIILRILKAFKVYKEITPDIIKDAIDDFDHIACDCVLIAVEFIKNYNELMAPLNPEANTTKGVQLRAFNFFEILYYLKKSVENTKGLMLNPNDYIKKPDSNARGVDIFRIHNISFLMMEVLQFLNTNQDKISIEPNLYPSLTIQIERVAGDIEEIKISCENFIKDCYPVSP